MNCWFEVFHSGRYEKFDSYDEAESRAEKLTSKRFANCATAKHAYIVKHVQLDNSDELVSIKHVEFITRQTWLIEDLM